MAKKKSPSPNDATAEAPDENTAGYFRGIFAEEPKLLKERSNAKLLERWLADHPTYDAVPRSVKNNLANIKSVLRSKKRKKGRRAEAAPTNGSAGEVVVLLSEPVPDGVSELEELEAQIDECMILAKRLDREGLHEVINALRRARNAVVWKLGQ